MAATAIASRVESLVGDLGAVRAPRGTERRVQGLASGGGPQDALQQPRSRGGRGPAEARRLRRIGPGRPEPRGAEGDRRARCSSSRTTRRCSSRAGSPSAVFRTHPGAPRVLLANSLLVPRFATWDEFRRLEAEGLTMFGQMTAGSWIYIGTQGILQGTYQTFAAAGETHWGSPDLAGRTVLTAGLGGMGGAQPLAASLARRRQPERRGRPAPDRAPPRDALPRRGRRRPGRRRRPGAAVRRRRAAASRSACSETPPTSSPRSPAAACSFDLVTDQTSAHDMLNGYVPAGMALADALALRASRPRRVRAPGARDGRPARPGDARPAGRRAATSSTTATTCAPRPATPASSTRSTSRASCRPTSGRSSAAGAGPVPVGGALGRPGRHRPHRRGAARGVPRRRAAAAVAARSRPTGSRSRACRRGSAGSATATAPGPACSSTTSCAAARSRRRS